MVVELCKLIKPVFLIMFGHHITKDKTIRFLSMIFVLTASVCHAEDLKMLHRYQLNDGVAEDIETGLMWMRCSLGQTWDGSTCQGNATEFNWKDAMIASKKFEYAGYSDWRLPTREELVSLLYCKDEKIAVLIGWDDWRIITNTELHALMQHEEGSCKISRCTGLFPDTLQIVQDVFPNTVADSYWTSSNCALGIRPVVVGFSEGIVTSDDVSSFLAVRLVRGGQ